MTATLAWTVSAAQPAAATHVQGATYTPLSWTVSKVTITWVETNDSITFGIYPVWDTAHRNGIQSYSSQGYRYSQEMRDQYGTTGHLNATGWFFTNFPTAVFDMDDDNGDHKREEAEITANYASFPVATATYTVKVEYSHNRYDCIRTCGYYWDPSGGSMSHSSQISYWGGEWQTYRYTLPYVYVSYPYRAEGSAAAADPEGTSLNVEASDNEGAARLVRLFGMDLAASADGNETDVRVPAPSDLSAYLVAARSRSQAVARRLGSHVGVVTFTHPLQPAEMQQLIGGTATLLRFEAIGSLATGLTATVGGTSLDLPRLSQDFSDAGATFHGITAAWVSVGDKAAYDALATNNSVLLVDLTEEAVRYEVARRPEVLAGMSGNLDVIVDDVYWSYAGLTK